MENQSNSSHHVAWADRIGINKQWARDIEACSESYGTSTYHHMVRRFKNNIPNIKDGPKLHNIIQDKEDELFTGTFEKMLDNWIINYPQEAENDSYILQKKDEIRMVLNENLYSFIIQLLEDQGFGFYKSDIKTYE